MISWIWPNVTLCTREKALTLEYHFVDHSQFSVMIRCFWVFVSAGWRKCTDSTKCFWEPKPQRPTRIQNRMKCVFCEFCKSSYSKHKAVVETILTTIVVSHLAFERLQVPSFTAGCVCLSTCLWIWLIWKNSVRFLFFMDRFQQEPNQWNRLLKPVSTENRTGSTGRKIFS